MESNLWHTVGVLSVVGFIVAIIVALVARRYFMSTDDAEVERASKVLGSLGGAANARSAKQKIARRKMK